MRMFGDWEKGDSKRRIIYKGSLERRMGVNFRGTLGLSCGYECQPESFGIIKQV
jgi:hypothetical protein